MKNINDHFEMQVEGVTYSIPANIIFRGDLSRQKRIAAKISPEVLMNGEYALARRGKSPYSQCVAKGLDAVEKRTKRKF